MLHNRPLPAASRDHRLTRRAFSLREAEEAFGSLVSGPRPLAVDGAALGLGLPARALDLAELRSILLQPSSTDRLKDRVWSELIERARSGDPDWVIGCVGVALPGLKAVAARAVRTTSADISEDIVAELLTEFVAQLQRIDLSRGRICTRLMFWARKGALRAKGRESAHIDRQVYSDDAFTPCPVESRGTAEDVLLEAVRLKVISREAAELIYVTRLQGGTVTAYARARGVPADRLLKRRYRAEARLAAAIADGQVSVITLRMLSDPGV